MTSEFSIGVHVLVYLSHKQQTLSSEVLAGNVCTNPARIRKIMTQLRKAGLVDTREGIRGGYHIAKKADVIILKEVGAALDESFVKASWKPGSPDMECLVASGMADVMDELYGEMNRLCMDYLEKITIADIEERIFSKAETVQ